MIDIPFCNVRGWHSRLYDKGQVKNNGESDLSDIASSCCGMVNIKWPADDEWGEDIIDTIEAVTLGPKGVYLSLIGTLVIIIHEDRAELRIIHKAHVLCNCFCNMSLILCHCLFAQIKGEQALPSLVNCAPSVVVTAMDTEK